MKRRLIMVQLWNGLVAFVATATAVIPKDLETAMLMVLTGILLNTGLALYEIVRYCRKEE